jgi:hypothetical protein
MVLQPVPPLDTPRIPVTSVVRFTSAVDTAPAVALRKPESVPMVSEFEATRLVDEAVPVTARLVVVAFVVVELPVTTRLPLIVEDADERNPARVLFPVTESVGAVRAPDAVMVVVAVPPIASVFPERLVVDALPSVV